MNCVRGRTKSKLKEEYLQSDDEKSDIINIKKILDILQELKTGISNLFEKYLNINEGRDEEIMKSDKIMREIEDQRDNLEVS